MSISRKIVQYVLNLKYEDIPADVIEYSKFAIADYYAVTYAARDTKDAKIIIDYANKMNNAEDCSIIGFNEKYSASCASLINGMVAHALDYDDVGLTALNHPTVVNAPVAFALAEKLGKTGKDILYAFTIGVEIQHKIALALMPVLTDQGWHTTSAFGTIGAATVAAIMYDMNEEQFINTLGVAVSLASGVRGNFGSFTKPFHAGMAAQNGIMAAELVLSGLTASENIFECNDGFAKAFTSTEINEDDIKLGEPWDAQFNGFQFKKYPVCSSSHCALDAMKSLYEKHNFKHEEIESIVAGVSSFAFKNLLFDNPTTPQEAKFSMPYALACVAVCGNITLDNFTLEAVKNVDVKACMPKVKMLLDDMYKDAGTLINEPAIVTVTLKDGRKFEERVEYALGTIKNPLSKDQLKVKFDSCLKIYNASCVDNLFENIFTLETVNDIKLFSDNSPK